MLASSVKLPLNLIDRTYFKFEAILSILLCIFPASSSMINNVFSSAMFAAFSKNVLTSVFSMIGSGSGFGSDLGSGFGSGVGT